MQKFVVLEGDLELYLFPHSVHLASVVAAIISSNDLMTLGME